MQFEFDTAKDSINKVKHGVSLGLAAELEWDSAQSWGDDRKEYGEQRQSALAIMGNRLYFVAFVDRGDVRRVISLRKANIREVTQYVAND